MEIHSALAILIHTKTQLRASSSNSKNRPGNINHSCNIHPVCLNNSAQQAAFLLNNGLEIDQQQNTVNSRMQNLKFTAQTAIGVGDGGWRRKGNTGAFTLRKNSRIKYFSGKYHAKFGHFVNF